MRTSSSSMFKSAVTEPSYQEAFYKTSNGDYSGLWHDGTAGTRVGDVPKISDVLKLKPTIRKPVRPLMTTAKCVLANQIVAEKRANEIDKVLSADVVPKRFPVRAEQHCYPESAKVGSKNPLYETSSQAVGAAPPEAHQLPDRFFPSTNKFTKGFVDAKPRYTGLNTAPQPSKFHPALDEYF